MNTDKTVIYIQEIERLIGDLTSSNISKEQQQQEILNKIETVLKIDPQNTHVLFLKGLLYQYSSKYDEAIRIFKKCLKINPQDKIAEQAIKDCKLIKKQLSKFKEIILFLIL